MWLSTWFDCDVALHLSSCDFLLGLIVMLHFICLDVAFYLVWMWCCTPFVLMWLSILLYCGVLALFDCDVPHCVIICSALTVTVHCLVMFHCLMLHLLNCDILLWLWLFIVWSCSTVWCSTCSTATFRYDCDSPQVRLTLMWYSATDPLCKVWCCTLWSSTLTVKNVTLCMWCFTLWCSTLLDWDVPLCLWGSTISYSAAPL